jgi:serine/threonine protein kinase
MLFAMHLPKELRMLEHIRRQGGHPNVQQLLAAYHNEEHHIWAIVTPAYTNDCIRKCVHGVKKWCLLEQLISGVIFLHNIGIIHRDIKIHNLLWNDAIQVLMICDFDTAGCVRLRGHCKVYGTDGFIAPEVLQWQRDLPLPLHPYTELCDNFAIGCVHLCLRFQIKESDMEEHILRSLRQRLSDDPLAGLLEHNPEKRMKLQEALRVVQLLKQTAA